jgi:hypothetical protein
VWGEDKNEPVTSLKSGTDFIMPLLGSNDIGLTVPDWNSMAADLFGHCRCELSVLARMGKKDLFR